MVLLATVYRHDEPAIVAGSGFRCLVAFLCHDMRYGLSFRNRPYPMAQPTQPQDMTR